jgi:hypothetical protein
LKRPAYFVPRGAFAFQIAWNMDCGHPDLKSVVDHELLGETACLASFKYCQAETVCAAAVTCTVPIAILETLWIHASKQTQSIYIPETYTAMPSDDLRLPCCKGPFYCEIVTADISSYCVPGRSRGDAFKGDPV